MATTNSRDKGKRGELELAKILRSRGYEARRGQQFSGANGDADVVGVDGYHIECKRVQNLNLNKAMEQSINDARSGEIPCVIHRRDRDYWKITQRLDDWLTEQEELQRLRKEVEELRKELRKE